MVRLLCPKKEGGFLIWDIQKWNSGFLIRDGGSGLLIQITLSYLNDLVVICSHLRKDRVYIYGHVACNVAVMKRKGVATLMPSKAPDVEQWPIGSQQIDGVAIISNEHATCHHDENYDDFLEKSSWSPALTPQTPCWFPLSWRTGFPRAFSLGELEEITDSFAQENIVCDKDDWIIYEGIYHETPVLITRLSANDKRAWSNFKILSRVRHRSISNPVGHCCTRDYIYLLRDYPCNGNLELNLQCKNISVSSCVFFVYYGGAFTL